MTIITVGELLDRVQDFEARLDAYYAKIRDCSKDNSVRLLTYYLSRHRRHQAIALEGLSSKILKKIRKIELQFEVPFDTTAERRLPKFKSETVRSDRLIETAIRHDGTRVSLYRSILAQPLPDDACAVLDALVRLEERDMVMLKKMLAMRYF